MELTLKPAKEAKENLENEGGGGTAVAAKQANLLMTVQLAHWMVKAFS